MQNVAVLGASRKPERYSYQAVEMLAEQGHAVFPVSPAGQDVLGHQGFRSLSEIDTPIDTLTIYLSPQNLRPVIDEILDNPPGRVIFNPGTESDELERKLDEAGIATVRACTLVLLSTGQFEPQAKA